MGHKRDEIEIIMGRKRNELRMSAGDCVAGVMPVLS